MTSRLKFAPALTPTESAPTLVIVAPLTVSTLLAALPLPPTTNATFPPSTAVSAKNVTMLLDEPQPTQGVPLIEITLLESRTVLLPPPVVVLAALPTLKIPADVMNRPPPLVTITLL
ncbi:MAG: hypothetical protein PCFJNLEI_00966 [Verrucomicrobiae bacterium]|nr:hypothetical protein [Verrucomicrobiae bacterium]